MYDFEQAVVLRKQEREIRERLQLNLLKKHLQQAAKVPFYSNLLREAEVGIASMQSLSDLSYLPLTSRRDIDENPALFGLGDERAYRDIALTSGTTGDAVVVPYTENDLKRLAFNEAMAYYGAGLKPDDRVLLTVTLDRCFIAGLAYYSGAVMLGAAAIRSGPGHPERQWQYISKLSPRVIVGVPTFLNELGKWGNDNGIDVANCSIDTIVTIGEPARQPNHELTPLSAEIRRQWGADIASSYGATEFETAFCECTEGIGGHVHPELMLVEIVDEDGRVLEAGQPGEVVVTPLGVEGFPLVRFRTGDVARLHQGPCRCGWTTDRLGAVEGRLAQRLKYRGTTLYPETIFNVLQDSGSVHCGYVEVRQAADGSDDITVIAGADPRVDASLLEDSLQARLRVRPVVLVRPVEDVKKVMAGNGSRKPTRFFDLR